MSIVVSGIYVGGRIITELLERDLIIRSITATNTKICGILSEYFYGEELFKMSLEKLDIQYDSVATTALALMEIPAIISGLFIAKKVSDDKSVSTKKILFDTIFNKSILTIFFVTA